MPRKKSSSLEPLTGRSRDFLRIALPAAARGNLTAVQTYLEQKPAFLHQIGPHGRTMLWEAARGGRLDVVQYLVGAGADIERRGCYFRETSVELSPWCMAVVRNKQDVAHYLQEQGAAYTFDAASYLGDTDHLAAMLHSAPMLADQPIVPVSDPLGLKPIHYAVAGGHVEVVDLLLGAGADVKADGGRLVSWALGLDQSSILLRLLDAGSVPRAGDINEACDDPAWSAILSDYGYTFDVNAPDRLGFPPLVEACRGNHNEAERSGRIKDLLSRGAEVNIRDHKGKAPLHRAAQAGFTETVDVLIAAGADIEAADHKNETPIFDAVRAGRADVVKQLLSYGARSNHRNVLDQDVRILAQRSKKPQAGQVQRLVQ